ncbi:MAG: prolipoprotein diacylglyceryl transferase [Elusimicrobia bacterium]|nr:prolipoprotein diacylglyceryl transferase [Elusimicrobiota bacterium]
MHPILFWVDHLFPIATYGVLVALGYFAAILYLAFHRNQMAITEDAFWKLIYLLFLGALGGGKILFLLLHGIGGESFWEFLQDLRYGFVFYGGFLGALGLGVWFARRRNLDFWSCADYFGPALALGHAIGRLGCFSAGCCYGKATSLAWGVRFTDANCLVEPALWGIPLHPTQLYEALGNFAVFLFLHFFFIRQSKIVSRPGSVFLLYILLYAILRFLVEFVRGDSRGGFLLGLSISQWLAFLAMITVASFMRTRGFLSHAEKNR